MFAHAHPSVVRLNARSSDFLFQWFFIVPACTANFLANTTGLDAVRILNFSDIRLVSRLFLPLTCLTVTS